MVKVSRKQFLTILGVYLLLFICYCAVRPTLVGNDSYYFLLATCRYEEATTYGSLYGIMPQVLHLIPCNIFLIKALLFVLGFIGIMAIVKFAELFSKNGWRAGIFMASSPLILNIFTIFENEQFAYPLLFISLYLIYRGIIKESGIKKIIFQLIGIGIITFCGLFLYQGSLYFLVGLGFASIITFIPALFGFINWIKEFLVNANPFRNYNMEVVSIIGIGYLSLLNLGIVGLPSIILIPSIYFIILTALSNQFAVFTMPFLAVGLVCLCDFWKNHVYDNKIVQEFFRSLPNILLRMCIWFLLIFSLLTLSYQQPTESEMKAIDFALLHSEKVQNDWGIGWFVKYKGGQTDNYMFPLLDWEEEKGIIITRKHIDCNCLKQFNEIYVYSCPNP